MNEQRFKELFARYLQKTATWQEENELMRLLADPAATATKEQLLEEAFDTLPETYVMSDEQADTVFAGIILTKRPARAITWRKLMIAASILLLLAVSSYVLLSRYSNRQSVEMAVNQQEKDIKAPETNKATVTLGNGQVIHLDSVASGELAKQGHTAIVKLADGKIAYQPQGEAGSSTLQYNTLSNPRGSKVVDMTLSDGSRVWLNAGSSLTFPVAFTQEQRRVTITGEAYFEVAHSAGRSFWVTKDELHVQVLGTHFNVNAYGDEPAVKVTLLEGAVKVTNQQNGLTLEPGQQAVSEVNKAIYLNPAVNTTDVMAWRNGQFMLSSTDVPGLMRQVARWYDVDVIYQGTLRPRQFGGSISNKISLPVLIQALNAYGIRCRLENKTMIIEGQ